MDEFFPVVDKEGLVIGKATRKECHSGAMILHPVVHLHIIKPGGYIYLQKRSLNKDIQPGKWDTAVGGHVDYGETIYDALKREAREELGIEDVSPVMLIKYIFTSSIEQELINTFYIEVSDAFSPIIDPVEIDDARFWSFEEVVKAIGSGMLTPNFEHEFLIIRNKF